MLTCHVRNGEGAPSDAADDDVVWFDLVDPTDAEQQRVEAATGFELASRERIGGIEMSSRAALVGDALYLNIPFFAHSDDAPPTPLGLVLSARHLVSIRYGESAIFQPPAQRMNASAPASASTAFVGMVESIVGQLADRMEGVTARIGRLSTRILSDEKHQTRMLRATLSEVGRLESRLTRTRLTSTGLLRIVLYTHENPPAWIPGTEVARLRVVHKDLDVLCELDQQLTDKLQFLLDAVLGFINIDQNDVMKILTVASVVSIPPIILVGIWGMNFVRMPELKWTWGYPMALGAIALSIVLPVLWFKRRGWL